MKQWTELIGAVYVSDLILVGSQVMIEIDSNKKLFLSLNVNCVQCFDTVGWAAGRASGLV